MKLVADIGGTNSRLAFTGPDGLDDSTIRKYRNSAFGGFDDLLDRYLSDCAQPPPPELVIAVAGPVGNNAARLTNLDWTVTGAALADRLNARKVTIINDLTALGHAVGHLGAAQLQPLGAAPAGPDPNRPALVVGIGTGFNVSPVLRSGTRTVCPSVEAGHASLPTRVAREMNARAAGLADLFPTIEDCFSGRGFEAFMTCVAGDDGKTGPEKIRDHGVAGSEDLTAAIELYADLLAHLLRDLALLYMPGGGIVIAGGVGRALLSGPCAARFAEIFQRPSPHYSDPIPVWLLTDDTAALTGCAHYA